MCMIFMMAGPRITTKRQGRKKTIIGTVSFAGSDAAFFSASAMRISRFSRAAMRQIGQFRRGEAELLGKLARLHADLRGDALEGRLHGHARLDADQQEV